MGDAMTKTTTAALMIAVILALMPVSSESASAQLQHNPNIVIDYVEPMDPIHYDIDINDPNLDPKLKTQMQQASDQFKKLSAVRDRLKKSQLLERYTQFLVALRLPTTLRLRTKECDQENAWFDVTDTSVNLCYEYVAALESKAPKTTTKEGFTPEGTLTGMIVSTLLHETGHALFSMYRVPILGREEDAADEIAGFVMMQFGTDVALTTMKGAAWKWLSDDWTSPTYYDVHSSSQARFYNFLCMAYGGNPAAFKQFVDMGWLPQARVPGCAYEYQMAKLAFEKTIMPHIDLDTMKKVQTAKWFNTAEMDPPQQSSLTTPGTKREE
jgi:predicted HD phosphohydrolase